MDMIVAADKNWGIGKDGGLLCHIPGDLRFFKEKTMGATVIMGRKTLESLPGGKPLPGRDNIVLTRSKDFAKEGCRVTHDIDDIWPMLPDRGKVFVIGGASLYRELLEFCDNIYVTRIDKVFDADTYFPDLDKDERFSLVESSDEQEENGISYRFTKYVKKA